MTAYSPAAAAAAQDFTFPTSGSTDHVAFSENGTTESSSIARAAVGATGWSAATVANPSVKTNGSVITSPAASGSGTITHFAVFSAASSGVQKTVWISLDESKTVSPGDRLEFDTSELVINLD